MHIVSYFRSTNNSYNFFYSHKKKKKEHNYTIVVQLIVSKCQNMHKIIYILIFIN